jgi:DNA-binding NtrC family response regulator
MSAGADIGAGDIALENDDLDWQTNDDTGLAYEEGKRRVLERFQRRYVERVMGECGNNIAAAARSAGITRAAMHRILKRLELDPKDEPGAD